MDDFAFQSAVKLVKAIQDKKISSSELLEMYIQRYERLNPSINAIVETDFETALTRARQADKALANNDNWGPLHGLPMTIKDYINVTGLHTTYGSPLFKDYLPTSNADVVQPLIDAGAIIFGKTNLPLWASNSQSFNEVYGQSNNPWDLTRTPGGSSGGSAAAIAAGLSGLEIGSDHAGSIRVPAHFCGIYGQQPPRDIELIEYSPEQDFTVTGPLARSAADLELIMGLVVMPPVYQREAIKIKLPEPRKKALKDFRIGVWIDDPEHSPDKDVGKCLEKLINNLIMLGANIKENKPDISIDRSAEVFYQLMYLASVVYMQEKDFNSLRDLEKQSNEDWHGSVLIKTHREWQLLHWERLMIRQKWADFFKEHDVLLCPTARIAAFHHDHSMNMESPQSVSTKHGNRKATHGDIVTRWATLAGLPYLPATIAPIGMTSDSLPVGVQIIGPYMEDLTTIHFAKILEESLGGFNPPPDFQ